MQLVATVATALSSIATAIGLWFLVRQLRIQSLAISAQSFIAIMEGLQTEEATRSRSRVYNLVGKEFPSQWEAEDIDAVEDFCRKFDVGGIAVRSGMMPAKLITDSWGSSLRLAWPVIYPYIDFQRHLRDSDEFWDDIEHLAEDAFRSKGLQIPRKSPLQMNGRLSALEVARQHKCLSRVLPETERRALEGTIKRIRSKSVM